MAIPFDVVIPARFHSSRLPGKLLEDIAGKSMIQRVIECAKTSSAQNVIVAYDDERIKKEVEATTDAVICSTSPDHPSGTDRVAEAVTQLGLAEDRIVVNVQGDEPMIPGHLIDHVVRKLHEASEAKVATAAIPLTGSEDFANPNVVKCVVDQNDHALYFSRCSIPWHNSDTPNDVSALHHIGIYAYRVGYLIEHAQREVCPLESSEKLEQLRVLFNGDKIVVAVEQDYFSPGVDTPEDLEQVRRLFAS